MRLTHVDYLRLPFGPLLTYDLPVRGLGRRLPVSFDQARHVGAGDRAGSWMALSLGLAAPVPRADLAAAWNAVVAAHATLRCAFVRGDDASVALHEAQLGEGRWRQHTVAPGQAMNDALREVLDLGCTPCSQPSHTLCVIETADGPTLVIGSDHAHVDMWSLLVIARDLLAALQQLRDGGHAALAQAPSFAEHTRALAEQTAIPQEIHRRWAEIIAAGGGAMPRFPLPLGHPSPQPERVEVRDVFDVAGQEAYTARARREGVSTLALTVAMMTETTRVLAGTALRAVFPVHSRQEQRWHDSVGWFITNSVLESADPDPPACSAAVREAIRLGSWPLARIMEPWGGMPVAAGMFAVSWLDLRRLPVQIDDVGLDAQLISAATRTDAVMLWFIINARGLHLRCRYPDTLEARDSVGGWLDGLVAGMREAAAG